MTIDEIDDVPTDAEGGRSRSIEDMLLEFEEQDVLIRDRSLLDPTEVVDEDRIVGRDEQLQEITRKLRVALGGNRPPNLFLYGPSGTGKSLITKAVCHNLRRICEQRDIQFGTVEVNCQELDTLSVAVYELADRTADEAGVDVQVPKHGVATKEKWDELYRIVDENFDSVVFVLDELGSATSPPRRSGRWSGPTSSSSMASPAGAPLSETPPRRGVRAEETNPVNPRSGGNPRTWGNG